MKRTHGFTLIELVVTMVVLAIIVAIAVPSFNNLMRSMASSSNVNKIRSALSFARTEAATRQSFVTMCPSTDGATCSLSADWSTGWIVFADYVAAGGDPGSFEADGDNDGVFCEEFVDDCVLRVWEDGLNRNGTLTQTDGGDNFIAFDEEGWSVNPMINVAGETFVLELEMDGCGAGELQIASVNSVGRISITSGDC